MLSVFWIEPLRTGGHVALSTYFSDCSRWQDEIGDHDSESHHIPGSIVLDSITPDGATLKIIHLGLDGWSQWVVSRNVSSRSYIMLLHGNWMIVVDASGAWRQLPPSQYNFYLYLRLSLLNYFHSPLSILSATAPEHNPPSRADT